MGFRRLIPFFLLCLAVLVEQAARADVPPPLPGGPLFMGYYESWAELPVGTAGATRLANLPAYLDVVAIGFARPDLGFDGRSLRGTGLQVPFDLPLLAEAIAGLKARNPRVRVVLAVGGSGYAAGWSAYAPDALARLVKALGADGVDLDYEPIAAQCGRRRLNETLSIVCSSDQEWTRLIRQTRAVLPRPFLLTIPGWSVGAYGQKDFVGDQPVSQLTGSMLWLERQPEAKEIDLLTIMAYEAGRSYDPDRAYAAYRAIWPGPLLLGVQVPPDKTGGPDYSVPRLKHYAGGQAAQPLGGIMLYSLSRDSPAGGSPAVPDAALAARTLCEALGRGGCEARLP